MKNCLNFYQPFFCPGFFCFSRKFSISYLPNHVAGGVAIFGDFLAALFDLVKFIWKKCVPSLLQINQLIIMKNFFYFGTLAALASVAQAYDLASAETLPQKEQYCRQNQYQCSVLCAGKPMVNECDPSSLQWNCICEDGNFPSQQPPYAFPIETTQCDRETIECVDTCLVEIKPDRNFCTARCKDLKMCGTAQANQGKTFFPQDVEKTVEEVSSASSQIRSTLLPVAALAAWLFA